MAKPSGKSAGKNSSERADGTKPSNRRIRRPRRKLGHVLIVEDEGLLAAAIEQALLDGGASSVAICSSTEEAMAELHRRPPDALVLDVNLADRNDGWALAELVVELNPRQPRIVFSTGSPERIPPEIAELGQILAKPYDPAELVRLLMPAAAPNLIERLRGAIAEA